VTPRELCFNPTKGFLFGGLSPPNKKITSLRPWRLCDENFILDKYDPNLKS